MATILFCVTDGPMEHVASWKLAPHPAAEPPMHRFRYSKDLPSNREAMPQMIRPVVPEDVPALLAMTTATAFFKPMEVDTLEGVLADYFDHNADAGDRCFVLEGESGPIGFVYHAEEPMTEQTWSLWWIVVDPSVQGQGHGAGLLRFVEADATERGGRVLFIETSGLPRYEPTCRFYLKNGYVLNARLNDYYAEGDDMLVYRKSLKSGQS